MGIYEGETRKEKEKLLVEEMSGVQRVPALLYTAPMATLKSINCQDYEVLPFEPLGLKLKKLTIRKFYDSYFHNITSHAPVQTRLVSGRSIQMLRSKKESSIK